jgi:hypothetical protein
MKKIMMSVLLIGALSVGSLTGCTSAISARNNLVDMGVKQLVDDGKIDADTGDRIKEAVSNNNTLYEAWKTLSSEDKQTLQKLGIDSLSDFIKEYSEEIGQ